MRNLWFIFAVISVAQAQTFDPNSWQDRQFVGQTNYTLQTVFGTSALCGEAINASSARYLEHTIDINQTPILRWQWLVKQPLKFGVEDTKAKDDFVARIYVVFDSALSRLFSKSLNYVWSSGQPVGARWDSPYTKRVKLLSVADKNTATGQWQHFERNLKQDIEASFGKDIDEIQGLAIMVDSDNTQSTASSCIANISVSTH